MGQARSILAFFSGNLGTNAIGLVASLLVARWTPPHELGMWNFALLIATYASVLQLGVFNGLNRQLPYYSGRKELDRSMQMAEVALAWCVRLSLVSLASLMVVSLYFAVREQWAVLSTTLAIGIVLLCSWSLQYLTVAYSASSEFGRLARTSTLLAVAGLALTGLVYAFGYDGLLVRASVLALLGSVALYVGRPFHASARWDRTRFFELARIGFPIWIVGQAGALFMTLDRFVLSESPQTLGYYAIAAQFAGMASMIPAAFNSVLYPRMSRQYGETHVAMALWQTAAKASLWSCVACAAAGLVAWFVLPQAIAWLLPSYLPSIEAAQWASLTGLAMGLSAFANIFNVLSRQYVYLAAAAVGVGVFFAAWFALTRGLARPHLVSAAQSMLLATFVTSLMSALLSRIVCRRHDSRRRRSTVEFVRSLES